MVQQVPHKGWTPLMLVVNAHSDEKAACLEVLLDTKADPNMRCDDGSPTALLRDHPEQRPSVGSRRRGDRADAPALRGRRQRLRQARHASALRRHHLRLQAHSTRRDTPGAGADPKLADDAGDTPLMEASSAALPTTFSD